MGRNQSHLFIYTVGIFNMLYANTIWLCWSPDIATVVCRFHWSVVNPLRPRQNRRRRHFQRHLLLNENVLISIEISLKSVPKDPINNIAALVQIIALRRPGDKPLSELMTVSLSTHIYASLGLNKLKSLFVDAKPFHCCIVIIWCKTMFVCF